MAKIEPRDTIRAFVVRARRIKSHSLAQNREDLKSHANLKLEGHMDISGTFHLAESLPENEEIFESLASRVRPLTLNGEPIHYEKVLNALEELVKSSDKYDSKLSKMLDQLRKHWDIAQIQGTQVRSYAMQSIKMDSTNATDIVSDTQLAAGWLYADLVHADAQGVKKAALDFSMIDRYSAAVRIFSSIALRAIDTLSIIENLEKTGVISIGEDPWSEEVAVGTSQVKQKARLIYAPVGSESPDLRTNLHELPGEWKHFTLTAHLRQDPDRRAEATLIKADGSILKTYESAVTSRVENEDGTTVWEILVADGIFFKFKLTPLGDETYEISYKEMKVARETNHITLAIANFEKYAADAVSILFHVSGKEFSRLSISSNATPEITRVREELIQLAEDLVKIEQLSHEEISACNEQFTQSDRVLARQARILWEGKAVYTHMRSIGAVAPESEPTQAVHIEAGTLSIAGTTIPTPAIYMGHPNVKRKDLGPEPNFGDSMRRIQLSPPEEGMFISWPAKDSAEETTFPECIEPWNLINIDENNFHPED